MKVFGYYHITDLDGQFSAAVIRKKYPEADIYGFDYGDKDIPIVKDYDLVIMSDISLPLDQLDELRRNNKKFLWIDHHAKTIREAEKSGKIFDGLRDSNNNNSACVLTWKQLYPKSKVPIILELVEDVDLWKFEKINSEIIYNAIDTQFKFSIDRFIGYLDNKNFMDDKDFLEESGNTIMSMINNQVDRAIKTTTTIFWNGYNTGIINTNLHKSKTGNDLLDRNPQVKIAMIWNVDKGNISISLRSKGDVDVAEIASKYGGGGHRPASGFHVKSLSRFIEILKE